MKKFPRIVQCDKRGQIVIPSDIRQELKIDESTGFWVYSINEEGILLKKIQSSELANDDEIVKELNNKAKKINISQKNIEKSVMQYKKVKEGKLDIV
jgi:AbrB family looped-hinge helix DNA binding protein